MGPDNLRHHIEEQSLLRLGKTVIQEGSIIVEEVPVDRNLAHFDKNMFEIDGVH
jgi:hypothetical protein